MASLAHLPKSLIERAKEILNFYENQKEKKPTFTQTSLFALEEEKQAEKENEIEKEIRDCNVLEMTPIEALNFIYQLKEKIKEEPK